MSGQNTHQHLLNRDEWAMQALGIGQRQAQVAAYFFERADTIATCAEWSRQVAQTEQAQERPDN